MEIRRYSSLRRGTSSLRRSPLRRGTSTLKRSRLSRSGKVGKANTKANRELTKLWKETGIGWCEPGLDDCMGAAMGLQNLHRHPRVWYRGRLHLLHDKTHVIRGCQSCHDKIDGRAHSGNLTATEREELFTALRGTERTI